MRRKTKIVLAITFMVAVLVSGFSYIYISELLRQRVTTAHETAAQLTSNWRTWRRMPSRTSAAPRWTQRIRRRCGERSPITSGPIAISTICWNRWWARWPIIYDAAIVDADGKAILHTNPDLVGKAVARPARLSTGAECRDSAGSCAWSTTRRRCTTCAYRCS